jgi:adenine-specific DNA-methyltransferase
VRPFAGSGSSLLAAKMLGRRYLGVEMSADYHAIASARLGEPTSVMQAAA